MMTIDKKILAMIEAADPSDTKTLDEIDARVWHWIKSNNPNTLVIVNLNALLSGFEVEGRKNYDEIPYYTRSRDALKSIRPSDWSIQTNQHTSNYFFQCLLLGKNSATTMVTKYLPTEELAELHAIIQAIDYERKNNDNR